MYSPYSDLHKMFYTPECFVFRVRINGKEYLGRPNEITVEHPFDPGTRQKGIFYTYASEQSFKAGYIGEQIEVTAAEIEGIEAIDTLNPEPIKKILAACFEIGKIEGKTDIGVIRRNIPPMLTALYAALEEYEDAHDLERFDVVYDDLDELKMKCEKCPTDLSEDDRIKLVRNLKEKVSVCVTRLIELSAQAAFY